jgi:aerobic-type carbon monoxide dehydrogenase small subunit (CoxS/CutS family)
MLVNGVQREVQAGPVTTLASVLRDSLHLTSVKVACNRGECGACTVLVAGRPTLACITLAQLVDDVTTSEGLAAENADLRAAFADQGAFQCGFCTPGQIVHATALLRNELPGDSEARRSAIREALAGNICRCTGYQAIVEAVMRVASARDTAGRETSSRETFTCDTSPLDTPVRGNSGGDASMATPQT